MEKDYLRAIFTPIWLIILFVSIGYGGYLQYRYSQPYRLFRASTHDKWKWALKRSFFFFFPFLFLGLMYPIITPDKNAEWWYSFFCGGISILLFPVLVVGQMVNLSFSQANYKRLNKYLNKANKTGYNFSLPTFFIFDKETKRFFQEGYPEDFPEGEESNFDNFKK